MVEMLALTAAGTAALSLTICLVLLRTQIAGRRPILALTRRWVAAGSTTSAGVIASLMATAGLAAMVLSTLHSSTALRELDAMSGTALGQAGIDQDEELAALRKFADGMDGAESPTSPHAQETNLPAVDEMIETLLLRLEREPADVRGWKMLGWSYLNTGRPAEATKAYETALRLAPADSDITAALDAIRAVHSEPDAPGAAKR